MKFDAPERLGASALLARIGDNDLALVKDCSTPIDAVAPVSMAGAGILSFSNFSLERTLERFDIPDAATLIVKDTGAEQATDYPITVITASKPRRAFIQAARALFGDSERASPGVHKLANIEDGAIIGENVTIGPFVTVEAGCEIKDGAVLQHGVFVTARSVIGENSIVRANSVIGVAGQAFERTDNDQQIMLPHLGRVVIGANCMVGAQAVIVTGSLEDTVIGEGCMIGNQVNIGHNCKIGAHCFIAPQTVIAGSVRMGRKCWVAPGAKVLNKLKIGDNAMIGLGAVVMKPVKEGGYVVGNPAQPIRKINKYNK